MKDAEMKLLIELLKRSNRSDRELAKAVGVSQPTISRIKVNLEKQGVIKEYTIIPDFAQLGFLLMSMTFTRLKGGLTKEISDDLKTRARERIREYPSALILGSTGIGCDADYIAIALHKDYGEYTEFMRDIREFPGVNIHETRSFLIDLTVKDQFRPLSFQYLAGYLTKRLKSTS